MLFLNCRAWEPALKALKVLLNDLQWIHHLNTSNLLGEKVLLEKFLDLEMELYGWSVTPDMVCLKLYLSKILWKYLWVHVTSFSSDTVNLFVIQMLQNTQSIIVNTHTMMAGLDLVCVYFTVKIIIACLPSQHRREAIITTTSKPINS